MFLLHPDGGPGDKLFPYLRVRDSHDTAASQDTKFRHAKLPAGYVTTRPGTRGADFYNTGHSSAAVIANDESLKHTVSAGELKTVVIPVPRTTTLRIHVPVMFADGQDNALDCNSALAGLSCASGAVPPAPGRPEHTTGRSVGICPIKA